LMAHILLDGQSLDLQQLVAAARSGQEVEITAAALGRVERASAFVEDLVRRRAVVYGVTTGFGKFSETVISPEASAELQVNLIRSHAAAVGPPLPEDVTRAVMLLRANALARGLSGIRVETLRLLVSMLNRRVHPVIPSQGSLGASGDLGPLAHMALVMIGEGRARFGESVLSGAEALSKAGLRPVQLAAKEGLALINGTQVMTALGALALCDSDIILRTADVAAAMTMEALRGIPAAYDSRIHAARAHRGQAQVAANLRRLLAGSSLTTRPGEVRVQDAYALRCVPQVHGACRDAWEYARGVLEVEMNAATDNPLVFADDQEILSGGNFHGEPVALALDFLAIALADLGNIGERRVERLVNPLLSGLPPFLTSRGGLNSGYMLVQYTAASLASENKVLASPASVDSIPSSAGQEDHVSMGTLAARKLAAVVENVLQIVAIELLCACQAVEFVGPDGLAPATAGVYALIREEVPPLSVDRPPSPDIAKVAALIKSGAIVRVADEVCRG